MAFTKSNIAAAEAAWKAAAGELLNPTTVDLYQGGTVEIKLYVGQRRASSAEVTGGADAENQMATIDADDWDAKAGRSPQKGDIIHWADERRAILTSQTIAPSGNKIFYKCRLRG